MPPSSNKRPRHGKDKPKTAGTEETEKDDLWHKNPEIIRRFLDVRRDYEQLCAEVEYILRKRISDQAIETSSITSRPKTLNSFLEKLQRKNYDTPFNQITDFAGARVVCLYRSDVAKVAEIIRAEFVVVEDIDKLDELRADQFGYGARHFIVKLGKSSSGARYDDLKTLPCEIQVRTVVQDAWAIIQHHMVYKRESQVPSQLQRKLNSLSGLFETVDDQFERIREEREQYVSEVLESTNKPTAFLRNELNLDTFKAYLKWKFPERATESWDGQNRMALDGLLAAGHKTLADVNAIVDKTTARREIILNEIPKSEIKLADDGSFPSSVEPALALALTSSDWEKLIVWGRTWIKIIKKHREGLAAR